MVKIASWNVNSIKARLPNVLDWLRAAEPDVVCLQEIKCLPENFPAMEFEALGYQVELSGQKSYNGVALLSKTPLEGVISRLPGDKADDQARYIEADTGALRVASIYLPNGNPLGSEKFSYKLAWMKRLQTQARELLALEKPVVLAGDFNVIPAPIDCYDPEAWRDDALFQPESRSAFRRILYLGYAEAWRDLKPAEVGYTFWDYQGRAWEGDRGIRIDHILLSPQAADRLVACEIDREPRGRQKASDHTPIWCELEA